MVVVGPEQGGSAVRSLESSARTKDSRRVPARARKAKSSGTCQKISVTGRTEQKHTGLCKCFCKTGMGIDISRIVECDTWRQCWMTALPRKSGRPKSREVEPRVFACLGLQPITARFQLSLAV